MSIHDQLVHPPRTEGGGYCIHDHLAGIDVANYLGLPLRGVCALLQEDDRCWLEWREREGRREKERDRQREGKDRNLIYYATFMINDHWEIDLNTSHHHLRRFLSATWLNEMGHVLPIIELRPYRPFDRAKKGGGVRFFAYMYMQQCGLDIVMNFVQVYSWFTAPDSDIVELSLRPSPDTTLLKESTDPSLRLRPAFLEARHWETSSLRRSKQD